MMEIDGKKYKVKDIMRPPVLMQSDMTLKDALALLVDKQSNVGCVVDAEGKLLGGVSTLSLIRAVLPDYLEEDEVAAKFADDTMLREDVLKAAKNPISDFVEKHEAVVKPDAGLLQATVISSKDCNGRIFVVDAENKPVGLLTRTEIKQVLAAFLGIRNELPQ